MALAALTSGEAGIGGGAAAAPYPVGRRHNGRLRRVCKAMDEAAVVRLLRGVAAPNGGPGGGPGGGDLVSAGLIDGIAIRDGAVQVALLADRAQAPAMEAARAQAEALLRQAGVAQVSVVLTGQKPPQAPPPSPAAAPKFLTGVKRVIAVASGKGGVGKSTVAVNLALALAGMGRRVGIIDADIYGPSLPRMLGLTGQPEVRGKMLIPVEAFGLRCMSIGFMVPETQAMIWRGPMVMGALTQMLGQTEWGALDIMVVDLPPGTGDAQLTLSQRVDLAGAVIVSTPQDIALIDARRGVAMFQMVNVPILGVVENMSFFCCPNCGHRSEIFGHGGAQAEAATLGVPFLGAVPLLAAVRAAGDAGLPSVLADPDGAAAMAFRAIAAAVAG